MVKRLNNDVVKRDNGREIAGGESERSSTTKTREVRKTQRRRRRTSKGKGEKPTVRTSTVRTKSTIRGA